jgi:hypothetical protein
MQNPTATQRRYIYRLVNALVAAAVLYGLLNGDQSAAFLLIANAALGLADANVSE